MRSAFTSGLTTIQTTISGAVTWFFESGKKVVSTFADGIRSAFSGAVDAVKGGLQRIRNMLPFSDAKEGPLSTLTLSGQRTMTTYATGLEQASNAPVQAIGKGLGMANKLLEKTPLAPVIDFAQDKITQVTGTEEDRPKASIEQEPVKKVDLSTNGSKGKDSESKGSDEGNGSKQIIIQKVLIPVDLKKIKDLQQLLALVQEISNGPDWITREGSDTEDDEGLKTRTLRSWSELAARPIEDTFINAAESVPGVLFAQADCQHPRGQGTVDIIVTGTAGEATDGLLDEVRKAVDQIAGPYDNILVR